MQSDADPSPAAIPPDGAGRRPAFVSQTTDDVPGTHCNGAATQGPGAKPRLSQQFVGESRFVPRRHPGAGPAPPVPAPSPPPSFLFSVVPPKQRQKPPLAIIRTGRLGPAWHGRSQHRAEIHSTMLHQSSICVLVGRDLIEAAAIRSQISQIEKYNTAANTFRTKYDYLPGDLPADGASQVGLLLLRASAIGPQVLAPSVGLARDRS